MRSASWRGRRFLGRSDSVSQMSRELFCYRSQVDSRPFLSEGLHGRRT